MCVAALPMIAAGTQLMGSMMSASAQASEGRRAREISDQNAILLEKQGRYDARQIRRKASYQTQSAVVSAAGNGLMVNAGSAMDIILDSSVQGEIEASNHMRNANDNARVERQKGAAAQESANNRAMGTLIGGFSGFLKAM